MESPGKKVKVKSPTRKVKGNLKIIVRAPPSPFTFESYTVEKPSGEEGYVWNVKKYVREHGEDDEASEELDAAKVVDCVTLRIPNTNNELLKVTHGSTYSRTAFIRYPGGGESTPETRQEGLRLIAAFLKDSRFSKYPATAVDTIDLTDSENPIALDDYFLDQDIKDFMEEDVPQSDLTSTFATDFPDFARLCWKHNHISDWGRQNLGFNALIEQDQAALQANSSDDNNN